METAPVSSAAIDTICRIPDDYYGWSRPSTNKSWRALLEASGYTALRPQLTAAQIAAHIRAHPDLVEDWERYSGDKRTSGGWYFVRTASGWVTGNLNGEEHPLRSSGPDACAEYILLELDSIRTRDSG